MSWLFVINGEKITCKLNEKSTALIYNNPIFAAIKEKISHKNINLTC